ncbi:hypothetical protein LTS10_009210 [Elasticomyces elasticus]|nr:hypothetical protein LTS10_009210 [Elasticomyces elasticus]
MSTTASFLPQRYTTHFQSMFAVADRPVVLHNSALMGLPVELRESIWEAVLAEDEPQIAYLERRVVARPNRKVYQPAMMRQTRRQIRSEAFPVYWKFNTFAFSISADLPNQVGQWQSHVVETGFRVMQSLRPPGRRAPLLETCWNVRLEFKMFQPDINAQNLSWQALRGLFQRSASERVATIDVRLVDALRMGKLELGFGGVLAEACTCWLRAYAEEWNDVEEEDDGDGDLQYRHRQTIAKLAMQVEDQLRTVWGYSRNQRSYSQTRVCEDCGKPTPKRSSG